MGAGGANSFTSPPLGEGIMAMLASLGKMGGGQQGTNISGLPPNAFSLDGPGGASAPAPQQGGAGPASAAPPGMQSIMEMMQKMSPDQLKGILGRLGIGGQSGAMASI
jgi:hypothetical protein